MPIGAIIGGAASLGGALLSSKSQSKAAGQAADTSLQVAQQNNALAQNIYGQNQQALSPFMGRGNAAGDQLNALLGLGGTAQPQMAAGMAPQNALMPISSPGQQYTGSPYPGAASMQPGGTFAKWMQAAGMPTAQPQMPGPVSGIGGGTFNMNGTQATNPQQAANNAFDIFRNSTGYQFRLGEGMDALNNGYAGSGLIRSGAAMKGALEYGQNFASNEFGNYANLLGNQQGVGLAGASALAGVGQNYVNTISNNNNSAGTAAANAALVKGANNPWANALGGIGGYFMGRA